MSYFDFYIISTLNKKQRSGLFTVVNMTCVSRIFDSHRFPRCSPFLFFDVLGFFLFNISLAFWLTAFALMFPAIYHY